MDQMTDFEYMVRWLEYLNKSLKGVADTMDKKKVDKAERGSINKHGYKVDEYRLSDKYGEIVYKTGTRYEVSAYALENQLLIMSDDE